MFYRASGRFASNKIFIVLNLLLFPIALVLFIASFSAILKESVTETDIDAHNRIVVLAGGNIIAFLAIFVSSVLFLLSLIEKTHFYSRGYC